ncbi:MAG TPA: outer membrane beta-barrel protein [Verrucomicrobiae bacterium]|jgi:opacity protein-like surface antigen
MKIQRVVIVIVSLFTASLAQAQYYWDEPAGVGPYFRAGVGPTIFQDSELKGFNIGASPGFPAFNGPTGKVSYDVGVSGDAAFGWAFNRYVGLDFDTGYTWGRMDSVQNYYANGSTMGNIPFLANFTLSLPIPHTNIIPYVGGGAGGSDSIFDAHNFTEPVSGNFAEGSESDVVFAWQAFAGVRFMLNPNMSLGIGYRYFATGNPTFSYPPEPNLNMEFQGVHTHTIMFTLQANF